MIKTIILIEAKDGVSIEEFRTHYENIHAPLALRLLPMITEYRRNYLDRSAWQSRSALAPLAADVITEMWFHTREDYEAFQARLADPAVQAEILADEARFIKSETVRLTVVEEHRSA